MNKQIVNVGFFTLFIILLISCKKDNSDPWATYTIADGLDDNLIYCFAVEPNNNIWAAGPWMLAKFDGSNWINYPADQLEGYIKCIGIDKDGNKWFGTMGGGTTKYDGKNWITYNKYSSGLAGNGVNAIAADQDGKIWFGTESGISVKDGYSWSTYKDIGTVNTLASNTIYSIAIDKNNNKWFGTAGGGVLFFNGADWKTYSQMDGLANNIVNDIAIDPEGIKWFATCDGVSKFDGTNWTTYKITDGLAYNNVIAITIDSHANKWFGCMAPQSDLTGVSKFDGANWSSIKENSMLTYILRDIVADNNDNIWFATAKGIVRYSGNN